MSPSGMNLRAFARKTSKSKRLPPTTGFKERCKVNQQSHARCPFHTLRPCLCVRFGASSIACSDTTRYSGYRRANNRFTNTLSFGEGGRDSGRVRRRAPIPPLRSPIACGDRSCDMQGKMVISICIFYNILHIAIITYCIIFAFNTTRELHHAPCKGAMSQPGVKPRVIAIFPSPRPVRAQHERITFAHSGADLPGHPCACTEVMRKA